MKKKLCLIAILLFVALFAVSCTVNLQFADATVDSIVVNGISRLDYYLSDEIDLQGATVLATYSDGNIEEIPLTKDMLTDYNMNVAEMGKVVTVSYKNRTTTFRVNVYDLSTSTVTLASLPIRRQYVEGETVSAKGARLAITYEGGKTVYTDVTDKMLESYDNTLIGDQDVYISFYGRRLSFPVTFVEKTVTDITVVREPYQASVFVGYGYDLSLNGMKLKVKYDNDLAPEVSATDIIDSLRVYIDDRYVRTESARVAYLPDDYPESFTYKYSGDAMVRVGDYVTPTTEIAGNGQLDNVVSKSYGVVTSISKGTMTISTVVSYDYTEHSVEVGKILYFGESIGRYGGSNVYASGGGGLVTAIQDGKIYVQTAPIGQFKINVQDRSYQSMVISTYPITTKFRSELDSITQGDTIDLSTGTVMVTFDNGERQSYTMDNSMIKVVNSDDDLLRSEIPDFEFTSVSNVSDLPAGQYTLTYGMKHSYPADAVTLTVSVVDDEGVNKFLNNNRIVSLDEGKNYTVSLRASIMDGSTEKVSECVYYLATKGAPVRRSQLDITAAGTHKLKVIFGGVKENSVDLRVNVIQRYPEKLDIYFKNDVTTDNITGKEFEIGTAISLKTLQYTIKYNNGDVSDPIGATTDMLAEGSSLLCDRITAEKEIVLTLPGYPDIDPIVLKCSVIPAQIASVSFVEQPTGIFLSAPATPGNNLGMSGGVLRVYYKNSNVAVIGRTAETDLATLLSKDAGERIELSYPDTVSQTFLTVEQIYQEGAHHTAVMTYYDKDGASASCELPFYVVANPVSAIRINRVENIKTTYIQCEEWDLTGVTLSVTYTDNSSETRAATLDMIYDSSTDVVGTDIPLKFRFLGKTDDTSLKITVKPRLETALTVTRSGKDTYYSTQSLDLSQYRFKLSYNAGASAEVFGLTLADMTGSRTEKGWWYELYDLDGARTYFPYIGEKIVRLYHTSLIESDGGTLYNVVSVDLPIAVQEDNGGILYISYDDTSVGTYKDLNVLAETAAGWDLFLSEYDSVTGRIVDKVLTVHYEGDRVGYVALTPEMLSYDKRDTTLGYTRVKILYKGFTADVYVHVRNATLNYVTVEKKPVTNFIADSEIVLNGGILKVVYKINELTEGELYKYLYLEDESITTSGFDSHIDPLVDHVAQEITVRFRDKSATYVVTVYNRQPTTFVYQNTIFFYGNTKGAVVTPVRLIPEFDLPTSSQIKLSYIESSAFMTQEQYEQYLLDHSGTTSAAFIVLSTAEGTRYALRSALSSTNFIEPANPGYDYYIVMEVAGNRYYRAENYALQKFTIIPKVIEVTAIEQTTSAYVKRYDNTSGSLDNARAIYLLYRNLASYVSDLLSAKITSVELLSPNENGFEVAVYVNEGNYENVSDRAALEHVFAVIEQAFVANDLTLNVSGEIRHGINIGAYNGLVPEYVSYRVAAGETLTRTKDVNGETEEILELLSGSLDFGENYDYSLGEHSLTVGTLGNKNYNVDFDSKKYLVQARSISGFSLENSSVSDWDDLSLNIVYTNGTNRYVKAEEVTFFTDPDRTLAIDGLPTSSGTYYARVGQAGVFVHDDGSTPYDVVFTINYNH